MLIVWLTWNVLVTQWLTDNLHSSCLNDSEMIKLIDIIGRLIMWCAHWLKLNWPFQRKNFVAGLTVFLNGWLHVTASDAARCLTDLMKSKMCFIESVVDWHQLTQTLSEWLRNFGTDGYYCYTHWLFGSVVIIVYFWWTGCGFWWLAECLRSC